MLLVITLNACSDMLLGEDPVNTPENNFDSFWQGFDDHYGGFVTRSVNWDSMYHVYRPQVNAQTTEAELRDLFIEMIQPLKDPHLSLQATGFPFYGYSRPSGNFLDYREIFPKYLTDIKSKGPITYGLLENQLGYVYIDNFRNPPEVYDHIDQVIEAFDDLDGIVIDVRNNGGGQSNEARKIASRFADKEHLFSYSRVKNGAGRSDLTDYSPGYIGPVGPKQFTKPVAILTNRRTGSAAEFMTLMFRSYPHVVHVGDTTGGAIAGPIIRELPNGWNYTLSQGVCYPPDKSIIEGVGIAPDVTVVISLEDSLTGTDTILETAMDLLK